MKWGWLSTAAGLWATFNSSSCRHWDSGRRGKLFFLPSIRTPFDFHFSLTFPDYPSSYAWKLAWNWSAANPHYSLKRISRGEIRQQLSSPAFIPARLIWKNFKQRNDYPRSTATTSSQLVFVVFQSHAKKDGENGNRAIRILQSITARIIRQFQWVRTRFLPIWHNKNVNPNNEACKGTFPIVCLWRGGQESSFLESENETCVRDAVKEQRQLEYSPHRI